MTHPVLSAADISRMTAHELAHFTDAPVAHAVAYADFRRAARIERENADVARLVMDRSAARVFA